MSCNLTSLIFYIIPILAVISSITSLIMYLIAKSKNKKTPNSFTDSQIYARKIWFISSAVVLGVMVTIIGGICALLFMAVAHM